MTITFRQDGYERKLTYDYPVEFNCRTLYMKYIEGGSFSMTIPISDKEFRKLHPELGRKPSVKVNEYYDYTEFKIIDDYGRTYWIKIDSTHQKIIEAAIAAAREDELLIE